MWHGSFFAMKGAMDSRGAASPAYDRLRIDAAATTVAIAATLRHQVTQMLRRYGLVVAVSGGIDSAVCAGLAVEALGQRRVLGLALPERESDADSLGLAQQWCATLGIELVVEDVTAALTALGCYARRDEAISRITPYGPGWRSKLSIEDGRSPGQLPTTFLVSESPTGDGAKVRLPTREFRAIVAATNFKQRVRTMVAYHHADRLRYAVCGTPNRLEYELGFFVKGGDGLADVKPIAHLYKSQVRQLAEHLGVPEAIRSRAPTTDTYSLPQTQEEFFFGLPLHALDAVLRAHDGGDDAETIAAEASLPVEAVRLALRAIESKRRTSEYLHASALLATDVVTMASGAEVG